MGGWELPAGLPAGQFTESDRPSLWVSAEPLSDVHGRWASLVGDAELCPLILRGFQPSAAMRQNIPPSFLRRNLGRPWHSGELEPADPRLIDDVDVPALLRRWVQEKGWSGPFRTALAEPSGPDPDQFALRVDPSALLAGEEAYLGLVPASDGAAALALGGWVSRRGSVIEDAALMRSWQQRFGVRLCALRINRLTVSVAWPPRSLENARLLAAEHFAYAESIFMEEAEHFAYAESSFMEEIDTYAASLLNAAVWEFWWD
ncbi:MAG: hypothetical protein QOE54_752 [Streptosporangiaceae bacterium]|nr:hypothetical protein [Streptosporangiaceae bacterium]